MVTGNICQMKVKFARKQQGFKWLMVITFGEDTAKTNPDEMRTPGNIYDYVVKKIITIRVNRQDSLNSLIHFVKNHSRKLLIFKIRSEREVGSREKTFMFRVRSWAGWATIGKATFLHKHEGQIKRIR